MTIPALPAVATCPADPCSSILERLHLILAELDGFFQRQECMAPSPCTRQLAEDLHDAAARLVTLSASLLRGEILTACRHAAVGHQRCGRKVAGGNDWDEAEQETTLRLLLRVRDLSREPIGDFKGYAFVVMDSLLKAWKRRDRGRRTLAGVAEPLAPPSDPADSVCDPEGDLLGYLGRVPSPVSDVSFADVYREMVRAERDRKVAAGRLGVSDGQMLKLWRAVLSLIRQRFSVERN